MPLTQEQQIQQQIWELEKRKKELQGLPNQGYGNGNTANYSVGAQQSPGFWNTYGSQLSGLGMGALGIGGTYFLGKKLFPGMQPSQVLGKFFNPMLRKLASTFPGAISENGALRDIGKSVGEVVNQGKVLGEQAYKTGSEFLGQNIKTKLKEASQKIQGLAGALESANSKASSTVTGGNGPSNPPGSSTMQPALPPNTPAVQLGPDGKPKQELPFVSSLREGVGVLQGTLKGLQGVGQQFRDDVWTPAKQIYDEVKGFVNNPLGTPTTPPGKPALMARSADGGEVPRYGWGGYGFGIPMALGGLGLGSYGIDQALDSYGDEKKKRNAYYALGSSAGLLGGGAGLIGGQMVYNKDQQAISDALTELESSDSGSLIERLKELAAKYYPDTAPKPESGESSSDPGYLSRLRDFFADLVTPGNTPRNSAESSDSGSALLANGGYYPRFADGGYVRRFDDGGSMNDDQQEVPSYGLGGWLSSGLDFVNWLRRRKMTRGEADAYNKTALYQQYPYTPLEQISNFLTDLEQSPFRPALGRGLVAAGRALDDMPSNQPTSALGRLAKNTVGSAAAIGIPKLLRYGAGFIPGPFGKATQYLLDYLGGGEGKKGFVGPALNAIAGNPIGEFAADVGQNAYGYAKNTANSVSNYFKNRNIQRDETGNVKPYQNTGIDAISPMELGQHVEAGTPKYVDSSAQYDVPEEVANFNPEGGAQWVYRPDESDPLNQPLQTELDRLRSTGELADIRAQSLLRYKPNKRRMMFNSKLPPNLPFRPGLTETGVTPNAGAATPAPASKSQVVNGSVMPGPNTDRNAAATDSAHEQFPAKEQPAGAVRYLTPEEAAAFAAEQQQKLATQGNAPQPNTTTTTTTATNTPTTSTPGIPAYPNVPPPPPLPNKPETFNQYAWRSLKNSPIGKGVSLAGKVLAAPVALPIYAAQAIGNYYNSGNKQLMDDEGFNSPLQTKSAMGEEFRDSGLFNTSNTSEEDPRPFLNAVPSRFKSPASENLGYRLSGYGIAPDKTDFMYSKQGGYSGELGYMSKPGGDAIATAMQQSPRAQAIINRFNNPSGNAPVPMTDVGGKNRVDVYGNIIPVGGPNAAPIPTTPISGINAKNQGTSMYNTLMNSDYLSNDYNAQPPAPNIDTSRMQRKYFSPPNPAGYSFNPQGAQYNDELMLNEDRYSYEGYNVKGNVTSPQSPYPNSNRYGISGTGTNPQSSLRPTLSAGQLGSLGTVGGGTQSGNSSTNQGGYQNSTLRGPGIGTGMGMGTASANYRPWQSSSYNTQSRQWQANEYGGTVGRYGRGGVDDRYNRSATSVLGSLLGGALGLWGGRNYAKNQLLEQIAEAAKANQMNEIQNLTNENLPFSPGALGALMGALGGGALGYYGG